MYSRISFIARTVIVAAAGFAFLLLGLGQASAVEEGMVTGERLILTGHNERGDTIRATERISIPYGFDVALTPTNDGNSITASGKGACTAGDDITIAFTVTQSSSEASAAGLWNGTCTGELQTWTKAVTTATPSPNFILGEGEACAFAETRDGDGVTATQEWCDRILVATDIAFLPNIHRP